MKKHISMFLLLVVSTVSHASEWDFNGYYASHSLNSAIATREGIDDSANGFGFTADFSTDNLLMISLGLEFLEYDDKNGFSQTVQVEGGFDDGDIRNEKSDASAVVFFAEAGPRWQFGQNNSSYVAAKAGFNTATESERSISNCSDCFNQDINIDGGLYIMGSISHSFSAISFGLQYLKYMDDDNGLEDTLRFVVGTPF